MVTNQAFLTQVETAISDLLTALDDDSMIEYELPDGRKYKREQFSSLLNTLFDRREKLQRMIAGSASRVRVAKLGRARVTDR